MCFFLSASQHLPFPLHLGNEEKADNPANSSEQTGNSASAVAGEMGKWDLAGDQTYSKLQELVPGMGVE